MAQRFTSEQITAMLERISRRLYPGSEFQFTVPYPVEKCVLMIQAAHGKRVAGLKISIGFNDYKTGDQICHFRITNWYGTVKVPVIGTIEAINNTSARVQYKSGISQLDAALWLGFPLFFILLLYNRAYSIILNLVISLIAISVLYIILYYAMTSSGSSVEQAAAELFSVLKLQE